MQYNHVPAVHYGFSLLSSQFIIKNNNNDADSGNDVSKKIADHCQSQADGNLSSYSYLKGRMHSAIDDLADRTTV